jgi:hypothetical protein
MSVFINDKFKKIIKQNVVNDVFPMLNDKHSNLLLNYLVSIVNVIAIKFNFETDEITRKYDINYYNQFTQNNYQDLKGLLLQLLPFIEDKDNETKKSLRSIDELYITKKNDSVRDVNIGTPKYRYSNIQFNRVIRGEVCKERQFNEEYLEDNYKLLVQSIIIMSNKLYVNWIDIRPYDIVTYKKRWLYKITSKLWNENKYPMDNINKVHNGLYIGDIYNVIRNNLYLQIKKVKWMIYVLRRFDQSHPYITILNTEINLDKCLNNYKWNQLNEKDRSRFTIELSRLINTIINGDSFGKFTNREATNIVKTLMIFFQYNYKDISKAIKKDEYIEFTLPTYEADEEEDEIEFEIESGELNNSIKKLIEYPNHLYAYIRDSLQQFKKTWYATRILKKTDEGYSIRSISELNREGYVRSDNKRVPFKLFYNFSKSLTSYTKRERGKLSFRSYPNFWRSLTIDDKKEIMNRFNYTGTPIDLLKWFNITNLL